MRILNCLVNHKLTDDQIAELKTKYKDAEIVNLKEKHPDFSANFADLPGDTEKLRDLASYLDDIIVDGGYSAVLLPIGSPAFMYILADEFTLNVPALFAHSSRISEEKTVVEDVFVPDTEGSKTGKIEPREVVKKSNIFKHEFFFEI